jgi:hypothetical protein
MNRFFSYLDMEWHEQFSSGLLRLCYDSTVTVHVPIIAVDRPDMPDVISLSICRLRQSSNSASRMQVNLSVSRCSQIESVAEGGSISSSGGMLTDLHMVWHIHILRNVCQRDRRNAAMPDDRKRLIACQVRLII